VPLRHVQVGDSAAATPNAAATHAPNTTLTNATTWNPTLAQVVLPSLLPLLPGEHTPIQFRFTAVGTSAWVIDDVFVDPRCRG
jgi:hypothetical protein